MGMFVMDLECDGLLDTATTIHCASFLQPTSDEVLTLTNKNDILSVLHTGILLGEHINILIGHNLIGYDLPILYKLLGYNYTNYQIGIIDTLVLSRLLYVDKMVSHSLEAWAEVVGGTKVAHEDWSELTDEMVTRNQEDVKLNARVFNYMRQHNDMEGWLSGLTNREI